MEDQVRWRPSLARRLIASTSRVAKIICKNRKSQRSPPEARWKGGGGGGGVISMHMGCAPEARWESLPPEAPRPIYKSQKSLSSQGSACAGFEDTVRDTAEAPGKPSAKDVEPTSGAKSSQRKTRVPQMFKRPAAAAVEVGGEPTGAKSSQRKTRAAGDKTEEAPVGGAAADKTEEAPVGGGTIGAAEKTEEAPVGGGTIGAAEKTEEAPVEGGTTGDATTLPGITFDVLHIVELGKAIDRAQDNNPDPEGEIKHANNPGADAAGDNQNEDSSSSDSSSDSKEEKGDLDGAEVGEEQPDKNEVAEEKPGKKTKARERKAKCKAKAEAKKQAMATLKEKLREKTAELKEKCKDLKEVTEKFKSWRRRHPDHDLSTQFNRLSKRGELGPDRLKELLTAFAVETHNKGLVECPPTSF